MNPLEINRRCEAMFGGWPALVRSQTRSVACLLILHESFALLLVV